MGTYVEQLLRLLALLLEAEVHRVFVQAIDELDEVCLEQLEVLRHGDAQRLERLRDELLFAVLSRQSEDVDYDDPSTLDVCCLHGADVGQAHNNVLLDIGPRVKVVQHYPLEGLEEVLLKVETSKLLLDQELVCELPQGVDGKNGHHEVGVRADPHEVLTEHLPYLGPNEPDPRHVQVCHLHDGLQTELARVHRV